MNIFLFRCQIKSVFTPGVCLRCEFVQSCSREYGSSTNMVERARFLNDGYSMDLPERISNGS